MLYNSKLKFFYYSENIKLFAVLILCAVSLGLFEVGNRYTHTQHQLLPNLDFRQGGKYWTGSTQGVRKQPGLPATVVFENDGRRQTLMTQSLHRLQRFDNIRVSAELKLDGVKPGSAWWQKAGVLVLSYDRAGKRMTYWPSEVAFLSGTQPWRRYETIIPTGRDIEKMQLFVLHGGTSGTLLIRNLQLGAVQQAVWFAWAEAALLALWAVAGIWILVPLMIRQRNAPIAYLALACFVGNLGLSVLPQPLLSTTGKPALDALATLSIPLPDEAPPAEAVGQSPQESEPAPDTETSKSQTAEAKGASKSGETIRANRVSLQIKGDAGQYAVHFLSHFIISVLAALAFKTAAWWRLALYLSLAAAANELLQIFVITRSAGLGDGLANIAGAAVGLILVFTLRAAWRRRAGPASA